MGVSPILVIFGAIYHWYPKITGRMLNETLGKLHFWVTFLGAYADLSCRCTIWASSACRGAITRMGETGFIPPSAHTLNEFITVAALIVGAAQLVFLYNMIWSCSRADRPAATPGGATTLEWQTPETPPAHGNWGPELPVGLSLGLRLQRAGRDGGFHSAERTAATATRARHHRTEAPARAGNATWASPAADGEALAGDGPGHCRATSTSERIPCPRRRRPAGIFSPWPPSCSL